ncbi:MAG: hypothetical protein JJ979_02345 [Roseibium sp.]|nr:hypothetical protein [Roseibium sp.]
MTAADIERCLDIVADLVMDEGGEQFVPLYERFERELAELQSQETTMDRVRARKWQLAA